MNQLPTPQVPVERTLAGILGIEITEIKAGLLKAKMLVQDHTRQPMGWLHGGAVLALAETAASVGTAYGIDSTRDDAFGQEINASLLATVKEGYVEAVATSIKQGRTAWVWDVRVTDQTGRLVAIARCTIAVRPRRPSPDRD